MRAGKLHVDSPAAGRRGSRPGEQVLSGRADTAPSDPGSRAALRRRLAEIRRAGIAISEGQPDSGVVCVACPVRGPSAEVVAAVSANGVDPTTLDRSIAALRAAANGITRVFSWPAAWDSAVTVEVPGSRRSCGA